MGRRVFGVAILVLASCAGILSILHAPTLTAQQPARFALLIGNTNYAQKVGPLKNPHHDVDLVGSALAKLGFKVTVLKDADYRSMDTAIRRHVAEVRGAGNASLSFFYFSGHGVANPDTQVNYLIPIDVADAEDINIWFQSFEQSTIIDRLSKQAPNATHYVVFDACRNELNLTGSSTKALGSTKGFLPAQHSTGILIAYATAPKQTASDVGDQGGPYAKVLAEELVKPGIEAVNMFRTVQIRVKEAIGQDPWLSFPSVPAVYLAGRHSPSEISAPPALPAASPPTFEQQAELVFWGTVKDSKDPAALQLYVDRYPRGAFADLAKLLIAQARREAEARQAEVAKQAAEAQRLAAEQKARDAETANQHDQLRQAQEEARQAREALKSAERNRSAAEKAAEDARRSTEALKAQSKQQPAVASGPSTGQGQDVSRPAPSSQLAVAPQEAPASARCDGVETLVGSERRCLRPKDTFTDCAACPEMVVVPAGEFLMGAAANDPNRTQEELPRHKVTIGRPFAVASTKITRQQFDIFVKEAKYPIGQTCWIAKGGRWVGERGLSYKDPGYPQDDPHPVVCVNWNDAKAYVKWLSQQTGRSYALLSEAEREYVGRAGSTTLYWWGASIDTSQANYNGQALGLDRTGEFRAKTVPARDFAPNAWGLHQVHGNVWEWTEDCWNSSYEGAPNDGSARRSGECKRRVVRGGSWYDHPRFLRSSARGSNDADGRSYNFGFRVARTLD